MVVPQHIRYLLMMLLCSGFVVADGGLHQGVSSCNGGIHIIRMLFMCNICAKLNPEFALAMVDQPSNRVDEFRCKVAKGREEVVVNDINQGIFKGLEPLTIG